MLDVDRVAHVEPELLELIVHRLTDNRVVLDEDDRAGEPEPILDPRPCDLQVLAWRKLENDGGARVGMTLPRVPWRVA